MSRRQSRLLIHTLLSAVLFAIAIPASYADNLMDVYKLALDSDPQFLRVAATKRATLEQRPQALAQLLPSIDLSANYSHNDQTISSAFVVGGVGNHIVYDSHGYSLNLTQPIFRGDRFMRLKEADSKIKQADAELTAAQQDLMIRASQAYFDVLAAIDNLNFARAEERSLKRQLDQAQQRFDVGLTAITDVQEAKAGYDSAVAQEIAAENQVDNAREALRAITGQYLTGLAPLTGDVPLLRPDPDQIDSWTAKSMDQNLNVIAAQYGVDTARKEIKAQWAGHLPTLDLVASQGYDSTGGRFGSTQQHAGAIGLQLDIPIFSGGYVSSKTREAHQLLDEQLQSLELARRDAHRQTREAFLGVISGISQVKALKQAVVSSETALKATEAGFEVGTRTAVDVVTAERGTSQAKRDLAQAKYTYILNTLRLKQAAGTLSDQDLGQVTRWLQ